MEYFSTKFFGLFSVWPSTGGGGKLPYTHTLRALLQHTLQQGQKLTVCSSDYRSLLNKTPLDTIAEMIKWQKWVCWKRPHT